MLISFNLPSQIFPTNFLLSLILLILRRVQVNNMCGHLKQIEWLTTDGDWSANWWIRSVNGECSGVAMVGVGVLCGPPPRHTPTNDLGKKKSLASFLQLSMNTLWSAVVVVTVMVVVAMTATQTTTQEQQPKSTANANTLPSPSWPLGWRRHPADSSLCRHLSSSPPLLVL